MTTKTLFDKVTSKVTDDECEKFDSPSGSVWIVCVDEQGYVHVIKSPNIHPSFFDNGRSAEDVGLTFEVKDPPGLYEWTCGFEIGRDWETGFCDDYNFYPKKIKLLYGIPNDGENNE